MAGCKVLFAAAAAVLVPTAVHLPRLKNHKTSKLNSISAVSIGYFTNLFVPRAGEITRCTSLSKINKIPVDKLFGTILIERVIDFIFLFSLLLITFILKFKAITLFFKKPSIFRKVY